jgi:hypothetical protein
MSEEKLFFLTELKAVLTMCQVIEAIEITGMAFYEANQKEEELSLPPEEENI